MNQPEAPRRLGALTTTQADAELAQAAGEHTDASKLALSDLIPPAARSYLATLPPFTRASARWRTRRRVKPSTALAGAVTTWGTGFLRAAKYR
ncbi:hypothetical protein [Streptomyces coeruleorubidus]